MKKIIYFLGIVFLAMVFILNLIFTTNIDSFEVVTIKYNNYIYIIGLILLSLFIFFITKKIDLYLYNEQKKKTRIFILTIISILYIVLISIWTFSMQVVVTGDQRLVYELAQAIAEEKTHKILSKITYAQIPMSNYLKAYPQQISLAYMYSFIIKILPFKGVKNIRLFNALSNILIIIALYKIVKHLSKKYEINIVLMFILIFTFISLPMFSTFAYGDIPSISFGLLSVYFIMKYTDTKKLIYAFFSSISMMIAYMMRMNSLIFTIAIVLYLILDLMQNIKNLKNIILNLSSILIVVGISVIPTTTIEKRFLNKYNLEVLPSYSRISYILMGMEEGKIANGWYNIDIATPALKNEINEEKEYPKKIKERLTFFSNNIGYAFNFYIMKLATLWTENTYQAVKTNFIQKSRYDKLIEPITFYQKMLLIVISVCSIIFLIQNRKNITLDIILLLTIFIGGFVFHILWEAKSRYIIPYIVVLIPIASMKLKGLRNK